MSAPKSLQDLVGTILDDRYQIERLVGQGGMGAVYLANQLRLKRRVAIKIPHPDLLRQETYRRRFEREARSMARLQHENICQVFDVFVPDEEHADELSYMIMEYVEGERLDHWVKSHLEDMTIGGLMKIFHGIAAGLDAAHAVDIVHRDIKPSNIILTAQGVPKIMDFGVAFAPDDIYATRAGHAIGTPAFMAPEQVSGKGVGPAADQYSFAMTLYKVFTGTIAFQADNSQQLILMQVSQAPTPPTVHNPFLPTPLELVLFKALSKQPEERFPSCGEMVGFMKKVFAGNEDKPAYTIFPQAEEHGAEPLEVSSAFNLFGDERPWHHRNAKPLVIGAASAVGLTVIGGLIYWTMGSGTPTATAIDPPKPTPAVATPAPAVEPTPAWTPRATPSPTPVRTPRPTMPPTPRPTPRFTPTPAPTPDAPPLVTPAPTPTPEPTPILPTPTPFAASDPRDLSSDDLSKSPVNEVRYLAGTFLRNDFASVVAGERRADFESLVALMPAISRDRLSADFDRLAKGYKQVSLELEFRDEDVEVVAGFVTIKAAAKVSALLEGDPDTAKPSVRYATRRDPITFELTRRGGNWYFTRLPNLFKDVVDPR